MELPHDATSAREARRFVERTLRSWPCDEALVSNVGLLTSELATNAVLHAGSPIEVAVFPVDSGGVRVEVRDRDRNLPVRRHYATDAMTGRGLRILETMASRWGAELRADGGKAVWFEVDPG